MRLISTPDQAQQGCLATTGNTHDGDDLSPPGGKVDALEHQPVAIGKGQVADFNEIV
jgi:hypothetical protein